MTKFTLEIDGLSGYGRKSIEATSPRDAIAIYWNHLGPMTVPSETRVYHGKGHEFFGIQQIMDIVAEAQGRKAENYLRLIE